MMRDTLMIHCCLTPVSAFGSNSARQCFCASVSGAWLLKPEYIEDCHKAQQWLEEKEYEYGDGSMINGRACREYIWSTRKGAGLFWGKTVGLMSEDRARREAKVDTVSGDFLCGIHVEFLFTFSHLLLRILSCSFLIYSPDTLDL